MTTTSPRSPRSHAAFEQLARLEDLDQPASTIGKAVRDVIPAGPVKDALTGTWLGHALHPLLTDVPIGTWTSAVLLDWLGGRAARPAADRLIGLGILASGPAAVTGMTDWADTEAADEAVRRIGLLHAASNVTALALFGASYAVRRRGARAYGKLLALAGAGALGAGGYLGGHLSYAEGVGVDQTAFEDRGGDWSPVVREADLPEGEARYAEVDGVGVMVARWQGEVFALSNRCAHRGGPLDEGEIRDGCVTCPLHGSTFRLADGGVERGPSPYPQPVWEARVRSGVVEVKAAPAS
ncbi:MAG TPA: Rieske 2Fe-2S domain-containing protein [Solirubrobacteraceae bacterium]|nr:Rieske 2Fe-2S domain-containing protein [Solirubrobacteraceae bacterium]